MTVLELIGLSLLVAIVVAAIAWFGPRRGQWRTHDLDPASSAKDREGEIDGDDGHTGSDNRSDWQP